MATKLSGVPLAEGSETVMMEFFDNETSSIATDDRMFTISDLLFYSHYQFELTAVYEGDGSTATRVNVTMTAEGSEFKFLIYCYLTYIDRYFFFHYTPFAPSIQHFSACISIILLKIIIIVAMFGSHNISYRSNIIYHTHSA
jgi:hypothetical protein